MIDFLIESLQRQLPALWVSLQLTLLSSIFGLLLGFFGGVLLNSTKWFVRYPVIALVEIGRGFPALLVLYLVYFGLPKVGLSLTSQIAAVVAFSYTIGGYTAEIFRAAIASVPRGQLDAAKALALSASTTTRLIVLPHVLRVVVPPLIGIIVIAFQGTSLAMSIGVTELTSVALQYGQVNFTVIREMSVAALLYFLITSLLIWVEVYAERRANRIGGTEATKKVKAAATAPTLAS